MCIRDRDNPEDKLHFGKEVSLKIYERREIAAGQSRYQIVQQPKFPTKSKILNDRRGDYVEAVVVLLWYFKKRWEWPQPPFPKETI